MPGTDWQNCHHHPGTPGGLVMQKMFTHPSRQPYLVPAKSSEQALEMLLKGQVMAAMIPTPLAAQAMSQGKEIATVATSPQTPHITLTAGPDIGAATREKIVKALLDAGNNPKGQEMLKKVGFRRALRRPRRSSIAVTATT